MKVSKKEIIGKSTMLFDWFGTMRFKITNNTFKTKKSNHHMTKLEFPDEEFDKPMGISTQTLVKGLQALQGSNSGKLVEDLGQEYEIKCIGPIYSGTLGDYKLNIIDDSSDDDAPKAFSAQESKDWIKDNHQDVWDDEDLSLGQKREQFFKKKGNEYFLK
jgi:hypothetical protein